MVTEPKPFKLAMEFSKLATIIPAIRRRLELYASGDGTSLSRTPAKYPHILALDMVLVVSAAVDPHLIIISTISIRLTAAVDPFKTACCLARSSAFGATVDLSSCALAAMPRLISTIPVPPIPATLHRVASKHEMGNALTAAVPDGSLWSGSLCASTLSRMGMLPRTFGLTYTTSAASAVIATRRVWRMGRIWSPLPSHWGLKRDI